MSKHYKDIEGSKGGKSGGGKARVAVEAPNTLRSRSTAKILDVLSEGEIVGLLNDGKSIYFNDTPVVNENDQPNYQNIKWEFRAGLPTQPYLKGFPGVESEFIVNKEVTILGGGAVESTSVGDIDAMRVTIALAALYKQNKSNGDISGTSVTLRIERKLTADAFWTTVMLDTITGKTMSEWEKDYRIERPGTSGVWEIRVSRITADATTSDIANAFSWARRTEIKDVKIEYENTALIGIAADAESTGGTIPRRSYDILGIKCQVPNNYTPTVYNPDGSVASWAYYSGTWGGVFKYEWTDDPAWIIYTLLTDDRFGLGLSPSNIDSASFYQAALYNSALLDDGIDGSTNPGGQEPRYRWNGVISMQLDSWKLLQAVASTCAGLLYETNGLIRFLQDRPTSVTRTFTNANVIDGFFEYTGTAIETRVTSVDYTYSDVNDRFLPRTVTEEATPTQIDIYGYNKESIAGQGIISEGHARRMAKWMIDTSLNTTEQVQFVVGWRDSTIEPGEVIEVFDRVITNEEAAGLITTATTTSVTLDRSVVLAPATTYKLLVQLIDDAGDFYVEERTITSSAGTRTTLTVAPAFSRTPQKYYPFIVNGPTVGRLFKVGGVAQADNPGNYTVTAYAYDPDKYARVEDGITSVQSPYSSISGTEVAAPTNIVITEESVITEDNSTRYRLMIDWDDAKDPLFSSYIVQYQRNEEQWVTIENIKQSEVIIDPLYQGEYNIRICATNNRGVKSPYSTASHTFTLGEDSSPLVALTNLRHATEVSTTFYTPQLAIKWDNPNENNATLAAAYKDTKIEVMTSGGLVKAVYYTTDTEFTFTDEMLIAAYDGTKQRTVRIRIYARDGKLNLSVPTTVDFTNPAPAVPTGVVLTPFFDYFQLAHVAPVETDTTDVYIWISTTTAFTPSNTTLAKVDVGTLHLIEALPDTTYYVRFAVRDTYSADLLNISSEYTVTTLNSDIGFDTPGVPTGLTLSSRLVTATDGTQSAVLRATWTASVNAESYDLQIQPTGQAFVTYSVNDTSYEIPAETFKLYTVKVRARNVNSVSAFTSTVTHTTVKDTTAPSAPTALTATAGIEQIVLSFTGVTATDLSYYEVYRHTNNTSGSATKIADINSTVYVDATLAEGNLRYYWIKAVDRSGNKSAFSTVASATALGVVTVIDPGSITSTEIADNSISTPKLQALAVTANKIAANTITANEIAASTITGAKIAANTITAANIAANTITANEIAANAITTSELAAGSVNASKIVAGSITSTEIATDTITANNIAAGAITATELSSGEIITNTAQIKNAIISNAKIVDATIQGAKIANAAISNANIADATITGAKIATATITAANIATATITNANIATGTITNANIADATIQGAKIANAAITSAKIADANITSAKIGDAQVTTLKIGDNQVTVPAAATATAQVVTTSPVTYAYPISVFMTGSTSARFGAPNASGAVWRVYTTLQILDAGGAVIWSSLGPSSTAAYWAAASSAVYGSTVTGIAYLNPGTYSFRVTGGAQGTTGVAAWGVGSVSAVGTMR